VSFSVRGFNLVESLLRHDEDQLRRFIRRMQSLNFNTLIVHYDYGWKRFGDLIIEETAAIGVEVCLMVFGPRTFLNAPDFTPQWLAKDISGKPIVATLECETKPCCHEPDAIAAYERGAARWLQSLPPQIQHVHVRCGDGIRFCECEKCAVLPEADRWQPFVDAFVRAWQSTRPQLSCEVDVYARRYELPSRAESLGQLNRLMYDTFYRHPFVPLGQESPNHTLMSFATSVARPDVQSPNTYHYNRLRDWTQEYSGKLYIHENLMMQGYLGVFQHNTGAQLQDLQTYRDMGMLGVIYEAYEPGYEFFAGSIQTLAQAMEHPSLAGAYQPSALERELAGGHWQMPQFCTDPAFPLERFVDDPAQITHIRNHARFRQQLSAESLRALVLHAFENSARLDYLYIGFLGCKLALGAGVDFSGAGDEIRHLLSYTKLWDFMESLPPMENPREITQRLIWDAVLRAR
jgi:hypothetical protein